MPVVKTYLTEPEQKRFAEWLETELKSRNLSRSQVAEALGRSGTHDIKEYLEGGPIAPKTLQKICTYAKIPWPTAFANAGLYEELLSILGDLSWLGERWCEEDNIYPWGDEQKRNEFRGFGVLKFEGEFRNQTADNQRFRNRYHVGAFQEDNPKIEDVSEELRQFYSAFYADPVRTITYCVPKPMAIALFIAASGFPRRGDLFKDGGAAFGAHLLDASAALIDLSRNERQRMNGRRKPQDLPDLLRRACKIFEDKSTHFGLQRVIAAEYVNAWADTICMGYMHYARLAVFAQWGEAGSSVSTATAFGILPQLRRAALPKVEEFLVDGIVLQ